MSNSAAIVAQMAKSGITAKPVGSHTAIVKQWDHIERARSIADMMGWAAEDYNDRMGGGDTLTIKVPS